MSTHEKRLVALRQELASRNLDGFVIPLTDEYMSEYVGAYAQRLWWLTGFGGSAGAAVVMADKAAIFVDGRYTLQVREQVDGALWTYESVPQTSTSEWLRKNTRKGQRIGYDPWLHTKGWVQAARYGLSAVGAELVAVESNPVDAIWQDRPAPSAAPVLVHGLEYAGKDAAEKRSDIARKLKEVGADAAILSALDSVAWAFNIRGSDVDRTPVALAYALVQADATADLFVAPEKLTDAVRTHLGDAVRVHARADFAAYLAAFTGKTVLVDPERAVVAIFEALEKAGARIIEQRDPAVLPKAIKNPVEISGHKAAQARDGAALVRFLHWVDTVAAKGGETELSASDRLEAFRRESNLLKDLSFDTISGFGPNGAVVHYRVSEETNRAIEPGTLFLVDSGGQYPDGTTDVTRTIAIGEPTEEMRDRFTRVLKGHIGIATAVFPKGTRGGQIDVLARQHLWAAGVDYAHGTGHGVGSFLSVHEGPQRIATSTVGDEPLQPGMIVSNEPGYYKSGEYGIRIENLVLVEQREIAGAEREMFGFETLTFVPVDRDLIVKDMLSATECAWIDGYHARVLEKIAPQLDADAAAWLEERCRPL